MLAKLLTAIGALMIVLCSTLWWSYSETIASVTVTEKVIVLTYDDGPNPPHTQAMLETLDQYGVKATFFLKGQNAQAFPELVQAIAKAGHEIGNHSYSHQMMMGTSKSAAIEELVRTNKILESITGLQPRLFRPPYGAQGPGVKLALEQLQMTSILMSGHGSDWEHTVPALIANEVLESVQPGGIVLLHDGHGDVDSPASQASRAASVVATGTIIESLSAQGYRFVTVGELLQLADLSRD